MADSTRLTLWLAHQAIRTVGSFGVRHPREPHRRARFPELGRIGRHHHGPGLRRPRPRDRRRPSGCLAHDAGPGNGRRKEIKSGRLTVDDTTLLGRLNCAAGGFVCNKYGFQGPSHSVSAACATSLVALYNAIQMIKNGIIDAAVVGGGEELVQQSHYLEFSALKALAELSGEKTAGARGQPALRPRPRRHGSRRRRGHDRGGKRIGGRRSRGPDPGLHHRNRRQQQRPRDGGVPGRNPADRHSGVLSGRRLRPRHGGPGGMPRHQHGSGRHRRGQGLKDPFPILRPNDAHLFQVPDRPHPGRFRPQQPRPERLPPCRRGYSPPPSTTRRRIPRSGSRRPVSTCRPNRTTGPNRRTAPGACRSMPSASAGPITSSSSKHSRDGSGRVMTSPVTLAEERRIPRLRPGKPDASVEGVSFFVRRWAAGPYRVAVVAPNEVESRARLEALLPLEAQSPLSEKSLRVMARQGLFAAARRPGDCTAGLCVCRPGIPVCRYGQGTLPDLSRDPDVDGQDRRGGRFRPPRPAVPFHRGRPPEDPLAAAGALHHGICHGADS